MPQQIKSYDLQYRVPYADTDQMRVVYYANYLVYFERIRSEMLRENGLLYSTLEDEGVMLPVISAHCDYKSPAFYDDLITIKGHISQCKGCRITFEYQIIARDTILVTGYTVHASISSDTRKPIAIPQELLNLIK